MFLCYRSNFLHFFHQKLCFAQFLRQYVFNSSFTHQYSASAKAHKSTITCVSPRHFWPKNCQENSDFCHPRRSLPCLPRPPALPPHWLRRSTLGARCCCAASTASRAGHGWWRRRRWWNAPGSEGCRWRSCDMVPWDDFGIGISGIE